MRDNFDTPEREPDPRPTPTDEVLRLRFNRKTLGAIVTAALTVISGWAYVYPWGDGEDQGKEVRQDVDAVEKNVAALNTDVAVIKETLANQKATLGDVKSDVSAIRANVETLMREVSVPEAKIRKAKR